MSPTRVESGIAAALPAPDPIPGFLKRDSPWLQDLRFGLDFLNGGWNLWVLSYNQERQMQLLARLGFGLASWRGMAAGRGGGGGPAGGVFLLHAAGPGAGQARPRFPRLPAVLQGAGEVGLERRPEEGPLDFAARAAAARPDLKPAAEEITALYVDPRYGPGAGDLAELRRRVGAFRP